MPATILAEDTQREVATPRRVEEPPPGGPAGRRVGRILGWLTGFDTLVATSLLALIALFVPRSMADPDIGWHLRNARELLTQHAFPRHDSFTFTAYGSPWIDHEWLAEIPFYLGWKLAGVGGVYLVTVLLIVSIFAGVLWMCRRASASWITAGTVTVGAMFLSTVSFGPRTLLFGWGCLVAELIVLELSRRRPRVLLALPPLYLLWVNLHGSWVIGLTVLAVFSLSGFVRISSGWIEPQTLSPPHSRMLGFAWTGIVPALFCNPWGWRLVAYPFDFAFRQKLNVANVQEWQSLDLHTARGKLVVFALLLVLGRQCMRPRRWTMNELALFLIGLYSAACYSRFLFLFAILAAPAIARSFAPQAPSSDAARASRQVSPSWKNAALLTLLLLLLATNYRKESTQQDTAMQQYPSPAALSAFRNLDPRRNVLNDFLWGGYLEWLVPQRALFIDSRVDIFEYNGTLKNYLDITQVHNTLSLLDRYGIDTVFFRKDTPLVYLLLHVGGWRATYDDGDTVLLERTQPPAAALKLSPDSAEKDEKARHSA